MTCRVLHMVPQTVVRWGSGDHCSRMPPFFLLDVSELYRIADRISRHADAVRNAATALATAIAHDGWRGIASDVFAAEAGRVLGDMRVCAGRLDDAADALRRHAGQVSGVLDEARKLWDGVVGAGEAVVDDAAHAVGGALHAVGL
jgi:uncharacterized protein YukE